MTRTVVVVLCLCASLGWVACGQQADPPPNAKSAPAAAGDGDVAAEGPAAAAPNDASAEVEAFIHGYVEAFNNGDLDAVAAMWAEDGTHVDRETGERTEGRAAIQTDLAVVVKERPGTRVAGSVDRVRFIRPDVAQVEGQTTVSVPDRQLSLSAYSAILVKYDDGWQIASVEELPVSPPSSPYEALQDLEWLVGRWVDDSETGRVDTTVRWSTNQAFLIRSYLVSDDDGPLHEGTQIIGWDPRSRQVRSWKFDSDGAFGDATWSRAGDDWLIKSTQTLADGRAASGTYVVTPFDDDTMTVALIGHEVEGEPQPSSDPVTVRRVHEPDAPEQGADEPAEQKKPDDN